jgi:transcription initiation factor IIE alpha subunit
MTRKELLAKIRGADENDEAVFCEIINIILTEKFLTEKEIACEFGVSYPTIRRWRNGLNAPLRGMRRAVYECLLEKIG